MTDWKSEWKPLMAMAVVFLAFIYLPVGSVRFEKALLEAVYLAKWYAREHVVLCLIPAFFIAGAIAVFVSQASVMKYLGAGAKKVPAYAVASVSGSILAVCSCTVLPLFAGIYRMGAGLGPATAFLYAGPAVNVLAIILTARILGLELGIARAVGAIIFSIIIGMLMHLLFKKEESEKAEIQAAMPEPMVNRALWKNVIYFAAMVGILIFANWGHSPDSVGLWQTIYSIKWFITGALSIILAIILITWFEIKIWPVIGVSVVTIALSIIIPGRPMIPFAVAVVGLSVITGSSKGEAGEWFEQSWGFARQILPLLFAGVLMAGLLLGRPGQEGIIPAEWIGRSVGGNSLGANLFASVVGAFMYFATLTEVPILQGLIGNGMGKGPALALLLAGPALSLPNMLVIRSVIGTKKTIIYIVMVVIMATVSGLIYGALF